MRLTLSIKENQVCQELCRYSWGKIYQQHWKTVDVVLGIRTHDRRMVGADGSTVL